MKTIKSKVFKTASMVLITLMLIMPLSLSFNSYALSETEIVHRIGAGYLIFDTATGMVTYASFNDKTDVIIPSIICNVKVVGIANDSSWGRLRSITLSDGITYIGNFMARGLEYIYIPKSVSKIEPDAFSFNGLLGGSISEIIVDEENEYFCDIDGVLFNKDKSRLLAYPCAREGSYVVPNGVIELDDYAFFNCSDLTDITLPSSVEIIGDYPFGYTSSLERINVDDNNENYCDADGVLFNKGMTELISFPGSNNNECIIPEGINTIVEGAFLGSGVVSVSMPSSVTDIGKNAFRDCDSLKSIVLPRNIKQINDFTFRGCNELETLVFPNGLERIGKYAVSLCDKLSKVIIPYSVTDIEEYAFEKVSYFEIPLSIYYTGARKEWEKIHIDAYAFGDDRMPGILYNTSCESLGHHFESEPVVYVYPDCTNTGNGVGFCVVCSEYCDVVIPKTDHQWSDWEYVVQPEYFIDGEKVRVCKSCNYKEKIIVPKSNPFKDIEGGEWYAESVLWCYENGYMVGISENEFGLDRGDSRAWFATVLAKINGADVDEYSNSKMSFTDVKPGKWYSASIEWAYQNGFTAGIGDGLYGYKNDVTLEQISVFFRTYSKHMGIDVSAEADLSGYSDYDRIHYWALDAMEWAVGEGLIVGTSTTTLSPRDPVSRAQMAVIIKNYVENVLNG